MSPAQADASSPTNKGSVSKNAKTVEASEREKDVEGNETENDEKLEIDENKENAEIVNTVGTPNNKKRPSTSESSESTPASKKVRSKPKPQIIENMKEYVDSNTTDKLTTTTLRYWLKERSLHCTTREKKADLIEKVCKHILSTNNS